MMNAPDLSQQGNERATTLILPETALDISEVTPSMEGF
jgi:hypothetical protein